MSKYKIVGENSDRVSVANSDGGRDTFSKGHRKYDNFLREVKEQGLSIVEGPDITTESYVTLRSKEYPPLEDQLDQIFHTSLIAWKSNIKIIKDKYPKSISGGTTVGDVPAWVQTEVDKLNS
jgi:hypothetical protein